MDGKLLELRSNSYAAATAFHRVVSEYFTLLRSHETADEGALVVIALEESAAIYANALDDLLAHLKTLEQTPAVQEETQRAVRIHELLAQETYLMTHFMTS